MRASRWTTAAFVAALLLPAAGFANDSREPGASRSEPRGGSGQGGVGGSAPPPSGPSGSGSGGGTWNGHDGGSGGHGGSWGGKGGGHHGGYHHRGGYGGWYGGWGGWGGWGWGFGYPYYYGGYPYYSAWAYPYWGYGYTRAYPAPGMGSGALDLDVSPERAEIWLDGRLIGTADDFDGFPEYLWLEKGTYDVAIYLPGYRTIARQYSIYGGLVIDVEDTMEAGESTHPNDLVSKSTVNRDERLRRDRETQEEARRRSEGSYGWSPDSGSYGNPGVQGGYREAPDGSESLDARGEPARLRLYVEPEDASVYLDGRFLGTGSDLARLRSGLIVDPGPHTIEVVRPGYASTRREIEVGAGGEQEVEVELEGGG